MNRLFILFFVMFATLSSLGQTLNEENEISQIRTRFGEIMAAKSQDKLNVKELNYECSNDPMMGSISFYYENKELVLIEHSSNDGSHGGGTEQYFISKGSLFFYFEEVSFWQFAPNSNDSEQPETVDIYKEERLYFHENKLIRHLLKEFQTASNEDAAMVSSKTPNKKMEIDHYLEKDVLNTFQKLSAKQSLNSGSAINCDW